MKIRYMVLAATAAMAFPTIASAATLISAAVKGPTGTVWATANAPGTNPGNYTLFLQNPGLGNFLNPNDEQINYTVQPGINYAFLAGDGFPNDGSTGNSDPIYNLELTFDNGAVLTGAYTPGSPNAFLGGTPVTVGNLTYTLTEFSFTRSLADTVGQYSANPNSGNPNDYSGNFRFSQTVSAVPEPATWGMMIAGFGMIGFGLRRRRSTVTTKVSFA
jgi:hypothetical protein